MRVEEYLEKTRQMPLATRLDLTQEAPFVVLSPHPDDETLGVGGLIRQACNARQQVDVIVLTDGAGSHTKSAAYPPRELVKLRKQEVLKAATILGLETEHIHHLDFPDAHTPTQGPGFDEIVGNVVSLMTLRGAKSLFVTWREDPHCDHKAAATVAESVAKLLPNILLWAYPIWGWHLDPIGHLDSSPKGLRLDISYQLLAKHQAIAAHASQMSDLIWDDPTGFRFTSTTLAPFLTPHEYFYEIECNTLSEKSLLSRRAQRL